MSEEANVAFKESLLKVRTNQDFKFYQGLIPDAIMTGNFSGKATDKDLLLKEVGVMLEAQELGAKEYAQLHHMRIAADAATSSAINMQAVKETNTERRVVTSMTEFDKQQMQREGFMRDNRQQ